MAEGDPVTFKNSGGDVSGQGGTAATPEASGKKGEIVVCLDLVLGFLARAMGAEERKRGKGREKRPVVETKKKQLMT